MIDRATITKIIETARIEDVVADFVTLKRAGVNLKGLCPFHDDRTPSFVVSPVRNFCKSFACGEGGNPVNFIMKHEQLSFPDAIRYLGKKYGIPIQEKELTPEEAQRTDDREAMFVLNEWARQWFRKQLTQSADGQAIGMSYLRERGFRDDIIDKFQLGYCPTSRTPLMATEALRQGYKETYLTNTPNERDTRQSIGTGLAYKTQDGRMRDRFAGRVIWPILTISGKVAGFGGRVLDQATKGVSMKYQNSPESIVYSKRRELYGLFQAKQAISREDLCYLVEGYTDVMAMHQVGVENVVASSGTALTEEQIRLIHRLTPNIVVVYDGDEAGIKASQRGIDMLLSQGMNVRLLLLPDGDDPDSFARKHTSTEFKQYIADHQTDFIKFKLSLLLAEAKGDPVAASRLVSNVVQSIAVIPDEIMRAFYVKEIAQTMGMKEDLVTSAVGKQMERNREEWNRQRERERGIQQRAAQAEAEAEKAPDTPPAAPQTAPRKPDLIEKIEREIIIAIANYGEEIVAEDPEMNCIEYVDAALRQDGFELRTPRYRQMLADAVKHNDATMLMAELGGDLGKPTDDVGGLLLHLLIDYKLALVKEQLRNTRAQMKPPEAVGSQEISMQLMQRLGELKKIERMLSLQGGDRVV